ncbi:hypothetical protein PVAND_008701 [Polypedilum vanderplanki]|uniref:Uncharacterized protein n=1 Tax=Polypedilum vanderplanki TaxID=319348 RepID=A0A9J6CB24_POLVA|nr:hypothetical protein PVAND_008701 [Polypedilum vanderplanki]
MKLSFLIFFLTILKFSSANFVTIVCSYCCDHANLSYTCSVQNLDVFTDDRVNIEKAIGEHVEGKTDDDVTTFRIYNPANLKYFPRNVNNVFKNLIGIVIKNSNLEEITSEDLKVFPKLKLLELWFNQIKAISKGTFKFNPELEIIVLNNNKISVIEPKAFSNLPKLRMLSFYGNICELKVWYPSYQVWNK